jgi:hypothetical protein
MDNMLGTAVRISILDLDKLYPVLQAERFQTKYGTSVFLAIQENSVNVIKVQLPPRYSVAFKDGDITSINDMTVQYILTYKGKCFKSNSYIFQIDP